METDGWVTEFRSSLESHTKCTSQLSHHRNLWFSYLKKRHRDANDSLRLSITCGSQKFRDLSPKRQSLHCSSSITCQCRGYDMTLLFPLCQCSLLQSTSRAHLQSFLRDHKAWFHELQQQASSTQDIGPPLIQKKEQNISDFLTFMPLSVKVLNSHAALPRS